MGRYWNTNTFGGKFGFGCQSSADPEIFGMHENTDVIHYFADKSDLNKCNAMLNRQYDLLSVPFNERVWSVENDDEMQDLMERLWSYAFREDENGKYGDFVDGKIINYSETFEGADLALCRVKLGLAILSDIVHDGYCEMTAEC